MRREYEESDFQTFVRCVRGPVQPSKHNTVAEAVNSRGLNVEMLINPELLNNPETIPTKFILRHKPGLRTELWRAGWELIPGFRS
jgi:hypothetical protein